MIKFFVPGKAASAGSKRAFKTKSGKLILVPASKFTKPWMDSVKWFAMKEVGQMCLLEGPLILTITFLLSRPKNHYGTGKNAGKLKSSASPYPMVTPDLTKLVRAVEDALTGIIWKDDKQVVEQHTRKKYGNKPGALIEVDLLLEKKKAQKEATDGTTNKAK